MVIKICHLQMVKMLLFLLRHTIMLRGVWRLIPKKYNYDCLTQKQPQYLLMWCTKYRISNSGLGFQSKQNIGIGLISLLQPKSRSSFLWQILSMIFWTVTTAGMDGSRTTLGFMEHPLKNRTYTYLCDKRCYLALFCSIKYVY